MKLHIALDTEPLRQQLGELLEALGCLPDGLQRNVLRRLNSLLESDSPDLFRFELVPTADANVIAGFRVGFDVELEAFVAAVRAGEFDV